MSETQKRMEENQDAIWDYFQNDAPESFAASVPRLEYLLSKLPTDGPILNIGVGSGLFEEMAAARSLQVYSLDPIPRSISMLQEKFGMGERAKVGYSQEMPFPDNYFAAVVMSEVFEHLSDEVIAQSIVEIRRVLRPGGVLAGTVPARENLQEQMVVCPDCRKSFHRWGHMQSFDQARIHSLFGATFEKVLLEERPFVAFRNLNWKGKIVGLIKMCIWLAGSHGSHENIFFLYRKNA